MSPACRPMRTRRPRNAGVALVVGSEGSCSMGGTQICTQHGTGSQCVTLNHSTQVWTQCGMQLENVITYAALQFEMTQHCTVQLWCMNGEARRHCNIVVPHSDMPV